MKALVAVKPGPAVAALEVVERPDPVALAGQVRVRVHASAVQPTDTKTREQGRGLVEGSPAIPHQDGVGVVDAIGDGVDEGWLGRRVVIHHAVRETGSGTAAELVCVPVDLVTPAPEAWSCPQAAGLGIPLLTAYEGLGGPAQVRGQTVLVTGGAGSVGLAAVQLASLWGAEVVTTISTPEAAELAMLAGAATVLNRRSDQIADELGRAAGDGFARVVDVALAENAGTYAHGLAAGAVVAAYGRGATDPVLPMAPLMNANASVRFVLVYTLPSERRREILTTVTDLADEGRLRPLGATHVFSLDEAAAAHDLVEGGVRGTVVVAPGRPCDC